MESREEKLMTRGRALGVLACAVIAGSILVPTGASAGGGCHPDPSGEITQARATAGDAFGAVIAECAFQPTVVYVEPGTEMTWVNKDLFDHTVTGAQVSWGSERFLGEGDTITQKFEKEGVFPYYCLLHPGMVGAVVVGDPDPSDITETTSTLGDLGVTSGSGTGGGSGDAADPNPVAADPSSDSIPGRLLAGTIVLVGLVAAVAVALFRRRARVHQEA